MIICFIFVCLGHVTKIELELMEAPDDRILVGPISSELNITGEINSTYPDGELNIPQYSDNSSSYRP